MPRSPSLFTIVFLCMFTATSLNMFLPALPIMAEDFAVSYGTISIAIGGYLAVSSVLALVLGPLSDRVGRRPVVIAIAVIFTLASVAAALSQTVTTFLVARFFQAAMVGGFVLGSSIVRDTRRDGDVAPALATISAIMALAPIVGPMIGGVFVDQLGWRSVFWFFAVFGVILTILVTFDITETRPETLPGDRPSPFDLLSLPRFWVLVGAIACSNVGFYIFLAGIPIVATVAFGLSASAMGLALGTITMGFLVGSTACRWISAAKGPRFTMILGRSLALGGLSVGLATTSIWPAEPAVLLSATVFIGLGNGLTMPSANAILMSLNPRLAGTAMGVAGSSVLMTGAVLSTGTAMILDSVPTALALVAVLWSITLLSVVLALAEKRFEAA